MPENNCMNKGLIAKIAVGLIVIAIPVFMIFGSKDDVESINPDISMEDKNDISNNLNEETFDENQDDLEAEGEQGLEEDTENNFEDNDDNKNDVIDKDDTNNNSGNNNSKPEDENSQSESKTLTAVFQGFADGSFIEMKIGSEYGVFKVSGDIKSKIESTNIGDSITFTYVESAGQKVITAIN